LTDICWIDDKKKKLEKSHLKHVLRA